jgi:uncharacterized protein YaiI (UPF0178 family)
MPLVVAAAVAADASPLAGIADACPIAESAVSTAARANAPIFHIAIAALLFHESPPRPKFSIAEM